MEFLNGITLLLIYELIGETGVELLSIPIPGPVIGMVLLLLTLLIRDRSIESLDTAGTALLNHFSLLFVPAGVGVMVYAAQLSQNWLPISLTLLLSTGMTLVITAVVMNITTHFLIKQ